MGYLDDLMLVGHMDTVVVDIINIEKIGLTLGLQLNHIKSEVIGSTTRSRQLFKENWISGMQYY